MGFFQKQKLNKIKNFQKKEFEKILQLWKML